MTCIPDLVSSAWLVDLCHTLSKDSTFYGFDIQPIHFPSPSYLPSNIHLLQQNVIDASIPADLEGSFDLVHIRAFGSSIRNSNASPILSAAHRLLKPGGWLQWDEADTSAMTAQSANTNAATGHQRCTALLQLLEAGGKATGTTSDWLGNLDKQFEGNGFEDVGVKKYGLRMEQYKAWTEDYLLVYEELAQYFPREAEVKAAPMTREKYEAFFDAVVAETNAGAVIHSQWLLCSVGKKRE